jgi:hypothetical protein
MASVRFSLALSCLVLSCIVWSGLVLSCVVLRCLIFYCVVSFLLLCFIVLFLSFVLCCAVLCCWLLLSYSVCCLDFSCHLIGSCYFSFSCLAFVCGQIDHSIFYEYPPQINMTHVKESASRQVRVRVRVRVLSCVNLWCLVLSLSCPVFVLAISVLPYVLSRLCSFLW